MRRAAWRFAWRRAEEGEAEPSSRVDLQGALRREVGDAVGLDVASRTAEVGSRSLRSLMQPQWERLAGWPPGAPHRLLAANASNPASRGSSAAGPLTVPGPLQNQVQVVQRRRLAEAPSRARAARVEV